MYDNPDYDPAEDVIDVLKDSVQDWMRKLRNRAYKGNNPEGGYEIAPAVAVGQVDEAYADFSIVVDDDNEPSDLSADARLEPSNRYQEPVPKESDDPIVFPAEDFFPAGYFGAALRSFSKAASIAIAVGVDPEPLEEGWKKCWGIQPDVDLRVFYGKSRSIGEAAWAGLNRKSVPTLFALRQSQNQVGVIDHGKNRKDIGEHKLVDWPRVKTICMAHAVELYADDSVARSKSKDLKLHYKLHRREVPEAPSALRFPQVEWKNVEVNPRVNVAIIDTIAKIRNSARIQGLHADRLDISQLDQDGVTSLFANAVSAQVPVAEVGGFEEIVNDDTYNDFSSGTPINLTARKVFESIKVTRVFETFAFSAAEAKMGMVPKAKVLYDAASRLGHDLQLVQGRDLCLSIFPGDILVRLYHLGEALSNHQGYQWVKYIIELLGGKVPPLTDRDLEECWNKLMNTEVGVRKTLRFAALGISKHETTRRDKFGVSSFIASKLRHPLNVAQGLSEVIHHHAIYWSNRYLRHGEKREQDKVGRQIRAKVLRNVRLVLDESGTMSYDKLAVAKVLAEVAANRVKSLGEYGIVVNDQPQYMRQPIERFAVQLDRWVVLKLNRVDDVLFADLCVLLQRDLDDFVRDIQGLVRQVISGKPLEVGADWFEPDISLNEVQNAEQKQVNFGPPVEVKDEKANEVEAFGFFGFDEAPVRRVVDTSIDLHLELQERGLDVLSPVALRVLRQYPQRVPYQDLERIYEEVMKAVGGMLSSTQ